MEYQNHLPMSISYENTNRIVHTNIMSIVFTYTEGVKTICFSKKMFKNYLIKKYVISITYIFFF